MAQQHINYSTPNSGNGDTLRTSQVKAESNFNELYANKVDKISGKGLSDTNYTQAEKDAKLQAKMKLSYLYSIYGMKDLYELACDLSNVEHSLPP